MRAVGVDVQRSRDCPYVVLDAAGEMLEAGWLPSRGDAPGELARLVERLARTGPVTVGIDAPRRPLDALRRHAFRGGAWQTMDPPGVGRHCEVVVRSLKLGNPQWTPLLGDAPDWMRLGFELFSAVEAGAYRGGASARIGAGAHTAPQVLEVFPSATYRALHGSPERIPVRISLEGFAPGPKDMLDAAAGALTALQVARGAGCLVGGGDGLGTLALPRPLTAAEAASPVLAYPEG